MQTQSTIFKTENIQKQLNNIVNVASVPQRSPFRYPGGKTWLIPIVRKWLMQNKKVSHLIEPFAGGGIVSLTAAFENLAEHITMIEIDKEIAAVWDTILNGKNKWLADKIFNFNLTHENIKAELEKEKKQIEDIAFCTILKNRVFHGGILAKGAGLVKKGENGKGLRSRWYPNTLKNRILTINYIKDKISFYEDDGFKIIEQYKKNPNIFFFIDPPYTIAGRRLYNCYEIDHERLFSLTAKINGKFMLTYDNTEQIRELATKYNLQYRITPMKTTHHIEKNEIIISDNFCWWPE
jgi:DNA adenine methylase